MGFLVPVGGELLSELSAGGTFEVARIKFNGGPCVCKRLHRSVEREPLARHALTREARVLNAVKHLGLPTVIDVGTDDAGPYLIETEVRGRSVRQIVNHWSDRSLTPPFTLAMHVATQVSTMLADLWDAHGFTHGDLSPDHIHMGPFGELGLLDFGASTATAVPADGSLGRGTVPFVSPEVVRGEATPDTHNDAFALGVVVLFLARGRSPTEHLSEAGRLVTAAERGIPPESLGDLDPALAPVLGRALSPVRGDRYPTMRDLARAFVELAPGRIPLDNRPRPREPSAR